MDIIIGKGYDSILFGLTQQAVVAEFGPADKIYELDHGDTCYEYHSRRISVNFDPELDNRVSWICIKDKDSRLENHFIWSKEKQEILTLFEGILDSDYVFEDYGSLESYSFEDHALEFQFELGRLEAINIGYLFDEQGNPIW